MHTRRQISSACMLVAVLAMSTHALINPNFTPINLTQEAETILELRIPTEELGLEFRTFLNRQVLSCGLEGGRSPFGVDAWRYARLGLGSWAHGEGPGRHGLPNLTAHPPHTESQDDGGGPRQRQPPQGPPL